jgi:hypothetical protein
MTIFELGALGEFVGALLLFISVIYVGVQIRQNTKATRAEIYQNRANSAQDFFLDQALNVEIAQLIDNVYQDGVERIDLLSGPELLRFRSFHLASLARMDNNHYQYERGFLDPEYYEEVLVPVIANNAPIWLKLGIGIRPAFRKEIDRILLTIAQGDKVL